MGFPWRFLWIIFFLIFIFLGLIYRILDLSYFNRDYYQNFVQSARIAKEVKKAIRGQIRDRNGSILAITTMKIDIGVDPFVIDFSKNREKIIKLGELIGKNCEEMEEFLRGETFIQNGKERRLRWKKIVTIEDNELYKKIKELNIKGIYGNLKSERIYPNNEIASHVIGFINKEGIAVNGVERFMDDFLKGQDGFIESEKDGKRKEVALFRKLIIDPKNGSNIDLTIDLNIQEIAEQALQHAMEELKVKTGSIIISDPSTGEILALCNAPTFNCNEYNKTEVSCLRNRAITDLYEPGSVFKIVPFSFALQYGLISLNQPFDCTQEKFYYQNRIYNLPKDHAFLGILNATDVLRKSSNRGAAQIGIVLGEERLYHAAHMFGFGKKTGYGFDGEASGVLLKPKHWDSLTITRIPMGHAISATPLQVHQAMGVIANGGYLLEPKVIARVLDENEKVIISYEPHIMRRVLLLDIAKTVREVLHHPELSASTLDGVKLAYKTGTSQKIINGTYSQKHHIASCSGFFPVEMPRFLLTVVLDDPTMTDGTAYGFRAAYPIFVEIAKSLILSYGLNQ